MFFLLLFGGFLFEQSYWLQNSKFVKLHGEQLNILYFNVNLGTYSRVQKSIEFFIFRPKMAIFQRAGMRKGGLPLPLTFEYLIPMI